MKTLFFLVCLTILLLPVSVLGQTTEFTYQGRLLSGGLPANGSHDFQFLLFDAPDGGTQLASTITLSAVNVNNGVFSVRLDFGNQFPGANRFLEIRVKQSTDQFFTVLTPRQAITSAPYAIKSLDAESASNTNQLGGVAASQYVLTTDARMSDARTPTPGSPEYIQNRSTQQPLSNFNVSGNGFVGGTLSANTALAIGTTAPAATFHLRINGGNVLAGGAGCNLGFTGVGFGGSLSGCNNYSLLGNGTDTIINRPAGGRIFFREGNVDQMSITSGGNVGVGTTSPSERLHVVGNALVTGNLTVSGTLNFPNFNISGNGAVAGTLSANTINATTDFRIASARVLGIAGTNNLFVGVGAGAFNSSFGVRNTFVGSFAGISNTSGRDNSFFGANAGFANNGNSNSFFGSNAGNQNSTGGANSFFGAQAGQANTTGTNNSFVGRDAGFSNTTGNANSFFGVSAGRFNTIGGSNSFFGYFAGYSNTTAQDNSFFGDSAGFNNSTGASNSFFGSESGLSNTTGVRNAFFASDSGRANTTGAGNSFFGESSGFSNTVGNVNSFFGSGAGVFTTTGSNNSFFGGASGRGNTSGFQNAFFGTDAGLSNTTGNHNTAIGNGADVASGNLSFATAIGAGAVAVESNTLYLGRNVDTVRVPGDLRVSGTVGTLRAHLVDIPSTGGGIVTPQIIFNKPLGSNGFGGPYLCVESGGEGIVGLCGNFSSQRYKMDIKPFTPSLDILNRLRPVSFRWRSDGKSDFGLIAEEVVEVEPLMVTTNKGGQVEGVRYEKIGVVLINAVKEQQVQIENQKQQIRQLQQQVDLLKRLVCAQTQDLHVCKEERK